MTGSHYAVLRWFLATLSLGAVLLISATVKSLDTKRRPNTREIDVCDADGSKSWHMAGPQIAAPCFIKVVTGNELKLVHSTWFPRQSFHVCWHMSSNTANKSIFGRVLLQALAIRRVKIIHGRSALLWFSFILFEYPQNYWLPIKHILLIESRKKRPFVLIICLSFQQ